MEYSLGLEPRITWICNPAPYQFGYEYKMEDAVGFKPTTSGFKVPRSINWATRPKNTELYGRWDFSYLSL